jgi:hypothetical protein
MITGFIFGMMKMFCASVVVMVAQLYEQNESTELHALKD